MPESAPAGEESGLSTEALAVMPEPAPTEGAKTEEVRCLDEPMPESAPNEGGDVDEETVIYEHGDPNAPPSSLLAAEPAVDPDQSAVAEA